MTENLVWHNPQPIALSTAKIVFEQTGLKEGLQNLRILDFGCGRGRYLDVYRQRIPVNLLFGTEIRLDWLKEVKEKGYHAILLSTDGDTLPFPDESFDVVFSSNVIEHIPNSQYLIYLREIHRILKPGGRFVVGTPNYPIKRLYDMMRVLDPRQKNKRYYLLDDPTHCNKLSLHQLENDLKTYFREIHIDPSTLFLERYLKILQDPTIRRRLRFLGYKLSGFCLK